MSTINRDNSDAPLNQKHDAKRAGTEIDHVQSDGAVDTRAIQTNVPCLSCGYNLRGISPNGVCPECGTAVRRTLLYVIDPARSQIAPLRHGTRLAMVIVLIPLCLLVAAITLWAPHVRYAADQLNAPGTPTFTEPAEWTQVLAGGLGLLAFGLTFFLGRPAGNGESTGYHAGLWIARLGLLGWGLLTIGLAVYDEANRTRFASLYDHDRIDLGRSLFRLTLDAFAILAASGFPRVMRFLALRSLYHRVVQLSRQGFVAVTVAIVIVAAGDALWVVTASLADPTSIEIARARADLVTRFAMVSAMLILVGSGMLTLALLNCFIDAIRLARHMNRPRYLMQEVVGSIRGVHSGGS